MGRFKVCAEEPHMRLLAHPNLRGPDESLSREEAARANPWFLGSRQRAVLNQAVSVCAALKRELGTA